MSGFTDAFYREASARLLALATAAAADGGGDRGAVAGAEEEEEGGGGGGSLLAAPPPGLVAGAERPPLWFAPREVWEVAAADLTRSAVHGAGLSLRFPRFLRVRDDKRPEDATTVAQLEEAYRSQPQVTGRGGGGGDDDDADDDDDPL